MTELLDKFENLGIRKLSLDNIDRTELENLERMVLVSVESVLDHLSSYNAGSIRKFKSYDIGMLESYAKDLSVWCERARKKLNEVGE